MSDVWYGVALTPLYMRAYSSFLLSLYKRLSLFLVLFIPKFEHVLSVLSSLLLVRPAMLCANANTCLICLIMLHAAIVSRLVTLVAAVESDGGLYPRPYLVFKNFQDFPSHLIFDRMHETININKKIIVYFIYNLQDESFKSN